MLDPSVNTSNGNRASNQSFEGASSSHSRSSLPVVHKIFEAATKGIGSSTASPAAISPSPHRSPFYTLQHSDATTTRLESLTTALDLSRTAPQAGFLQKMGVNIPEFKRRFFVLCPSTRLYYYLSPHDTQPRGFVELDESAKIEELEHLPDGRFRFSVSWYENGSVEGKNNEKRQQIQRQIILEARSKEIGQQWMQNMDEERISTQKLRADVLFNENVAYQARIKDLERQVDNFKMVEQDRDGALEDAQKWKKQFERLDEAIRLLTQQIRRPPTSPPAATTKSMGRTTEDHGTQQGNLQLDGVDGNSDDFDSKGEEKKEATTETAEQRHAASALCENVQNLPPQSPDQQKNERDSSLLDATIEEDNQDQDIADLFHVPGTYFAALSNACRQQRQSLRLAASEATKSVEDLHEAQAKLAAMDKRMDKAEKHLCKLWEENCLIRKSLKQKKREKRVLVREVKALQHQLATEHQEQEERIRLQTAEQQQHRWERTSRTEQSQRKTFQHSDEHARIETIRQDDDEEADASMVSEDERLLTELEEHVASTILLHERLLAASGELPIPTKTNTKKQDVSHPTRDVKVSAALDTSIDSFDIDTAAGDLTRKVSAATSRGGGTLKLEKSNVGSDSAQSGRLSPLQPKLLSLFDEDDSVEEEENDDDDQDDAERASRQSDLDSSSLATQSVICSVSAEVGDSTDDSLRSGLRSSSKISNTQRRNPLLNLDEEDENHRSVEERETVIKSTITDNGHATSRLICPLADVVETKKGHLCSRGPGESNEELRVYHLTFYTQKIGIQFQKAPTAPARSKGLLTDAMTADLAGEQNGSGKTASELRGIATISQWAKSGGNHNRRDGTGKDKKIDLYCPVATPKDAVLVCGFTGFEESGNNVRPKLGARLVAFDGISVEIGKWTFDSIRKAIKARGRPLTLSFRDDFLTTEQRSILTKAVADVEAATAKQVASRQLVQRTTAIQHARPPSTTPSITSVLSHESDHFVNEELVYPPGELVARQEEDDLSTSVASSDYIQSRRGFSSSNNSVSTHQGSCRDFYSFSEAGTSSVVSSAFAPLMANLLNGISDRTSAKETPEYLRRNDSLENTPQHREFQSNLL